MPKISVVTSLYRSSPFIRQFYDRNLKCIRQLGLDYEFVFVNDGSPDDSGGVVAGIARGDKHVVLINLSRNFGQYAAMYAGMLHARGDYIFVLDCDLEEEPEDLIAFYNMMISQPEIDVVFGVVQAREGGIIKKNIGNIFYNILDFFNEHSIPRNQAWSRLMKKAFVSELLRYKEAETFPAGLMFITGFNQVPCIIQKKYKGYTTYSAAKRIRAATNAITSFNSKPLEFISLLGGGISFLSGIVLIGLVFEKIFAIKFQAGWISLIASIWLVGGLILFSLGVIGIYISKIFNQVKNRPLFIIQSMINHGQNNN